ncbi:unnamed protein product [Ixodes persulcatus]
MNCCCRRVLYNRVTTSSTGSFSGHRRPCSRGAAVLVSLSPLLSCVTWAGSQLTFLLPGTHTHTGTAASECRRGSSLEPISFALPRRRALRVSCCCFALFPRAARWCAR